MKRLQRPANRTSRFWPICASLVLGTPTAILAQSECPSLGQYPSCFPNQTLWPFVRGAKPIANTASFPEDATTCWYEVRNYEEHNGIPGIQASDRYNFTLDRTTGQPISIADPTIIWLPGINGGWYYLTGTDDDRCTANFMVYRTRDFVHFFQHKLAFADSTRQGRVIHIVEPRYDDRVYAGLHSPQLFVDPLDPQTVHLAFTATIGYLDNPQDSFEYHNVRTVPYRNSQNQLEYVNPLYPWDSTCALNTHCPGIDPATIWTSCDASALCDQFFVVLQQVSRYQAAYVTSMPSEAFISTDTAQNFTTTGSGIRWFAYCIDNSCISPPPGSCDEEVNPDGYLYDGGQSLSPPRFVPSSASAYLSDASYCVDRPLMHCECFENLDLGQCYSLTCCPPFGLAHRRVVGGPIFKTCGSIADLIWSDATFMTDGSFMFYDPGDNQRPWMLYGWTSAGCTPSQDDRLRWRGNHIAGARITRSGLHNDWQFDVSDSSFSALPFAYRKNLLDNCDVLQPDGCLNAFGLGHECEWCIAESPSAFFHPGSSAYYLLYSRNLWNGGAYSVMYRAGLASGGTFASMTLPGGFEDSTVTEHRLVSARRFLPGGGVEDRRTEPRGRSYGSAELFYLRDPSGCILTDEAGQRLLYAAFHAKMDGSDARTLFIKRVHFQLPPNQHLLSEMLEDDSADPKLDPWRLQLPGRPCLADWNQDDVIKSQDYYDFNACFFSPSTCPGRDLDIDGSGAVNSQDWFDWLALWYAGCP